MSKSQPRSKSKDTNDLIKRAQKAGWTAEKTRGSHIRLTSPTGVVVHHASTSGDWRSLRNFRARLRRGGLDV